MQKIRQNVYVKKIMPGSKKKKKKNGPSVRPPFTTASIASRSAMATTARVCAAQKKGVKGKHWSEDEKLELVHLIRDRKKSSWKGLIQKQHSKQKSVHGVTSAKF